MTNEEQLIDLAKKGDKNAMTELYLGYEGLIIKAAHQTHLFTIEEEAVCAAKESFINAVLNFDSTLGIHFPAYAKAKIYGDLRTLFKQYQRQWNREVYPAETNDEISFWDTVEDTGTRPDKFADENTFEEIIKALPPRQQTLLRLMYQKECTQKKAAALMGITPQAAAAIKKRAIASLRTKLLRG